MSLPYYINPCFLAAFSMLDWKLSKRLFSTDPAVFSSVSAKNLYPGIFPVWWPSRRYCLLHETDGWLRRRIRMCIWKAWKLPKTRMKNLVRCGINKYDARRWGYVKGYWRVSSSPIMHLAASTQKLHQAGYPTLMGSYLEWHPK